LKKKQEKWGREEKERKGMCERRNKIYMQNEKNLRERKLGPSFPRNPHP
jgi:hypothetical protein